MSNSAEEAASPDLQVRMFIPARESRQQEELREEIVKITDKVKWGIAVRRAARHIVTGGAAQGRSYDLVAPKHAAEAYKTAHRVRTLVVSTGTCFVRRNPGKDPRALPDLVSIENFVRYKAMFTMIRERRDVARAFADFDAWPQEGACSGMHDPRLLPLYTFDNNADWPALDQVGEIRRFDNRFGPAARRTDPTGRLWIQ